MDINFDTGRISRSDIRHPVGKPPVTSAASDAASLERTEALKARLKELPLVRPEKVAAARARLENVQYPPDEFMDGIANLLAKRLSE